MNGPELKSLFMTQGDIASSASKAVHSKKSCSGSPDSGEKHWTTMQSSHPNTCGTEKRLRPQDPEKIWETQGTFLYGTVLCCCLRSGGRGGVCLRNARVRITACLWRGRSVRDCQNRVSRRKPTWCYCPMSCHLPPQTQSCTTTPCFRMPCQCTMRYEEITPKPWKMKKHTICSILPRPPQYSACNTTQHSITRDQSRRKVISREHCYCALGVIRAKICFNKGRIQHPQRPLFMFHLSATYVGGGRKAKLNSGGKRKDFSLANLALLTSAVMLLGDNDGGQGWSHVSWVTVLNCIQAFYL